MPSPEIAHPTVPPDVIVPLAAMPPSKLLLLITLLTRTIFALNSLAVIVLDAICSPVIVLGDSLIPAGPSVVSLTIESISNLKPAAFSLCFCPLWPLPTVTPISQSYIEYWLVLINPEEIPS